MPPCQGGWGVAPPARGVGGLPPSQGGWGVIPARGVGGSYLPGGLGGDELLLLLFNPPVYAVFCVADVAGIRIMSYIMSYAYDSTY